MAPEEFIVYVDNLPDDCIDERTEEQIIFHLSKKKYTCPACGSTHTLVDQYRKQVLKGIPDTALRYIYRVRRYRCDSCGKTFPEENPFGGRNQQLFGNTLKRLRGNKKIRRFQWRQSSCSSSSFSAFVSLAEIVFASSSE